MKTITKNIYSFNELSKEAQEKAHQEYIKNNEYEGLLSEMIDTLKDELKNHNIEETGFTKVLYSLSHSQGDGACFIGDFTWDNIEISITHNFRYYHEYSTTIDGYFKSAKQEEEFKKIYYKICNQLETIGYNYISMEDSLETFTQLAEDMDYMFYEDGTII